MCSIEIERTNVIMFKNISIMGRVIYIIYVIELYVKEKDNNADWNILYEALWSFPESEYIDDYAYMVIECTPGCVLDEREDFQDYEYFNVEDACKLKKLYMESSCTETVDYLMNQINDILGCNLYTSVKPPESHSLKIIEETYSYIEKLMGENVPPIKPFEIYSIYDQQCWGDYSFGKKELLERMNNC